MSSVIWCLIFPVAFFTISSLIFQGNQNTAPLSSTQDIIFCDFPDYNLGGNSTGNGCIGDHDQPYSDDQFVIWNATGAWYSGGSEWVASVPIGNWVHMSDGISVFFAKIGAILLYFPLLILTLSTPVDLQTELGAPITGAYSVIWGIFFFGVYKGLSPFTGSR